MSLILSSLIAIPLIGFLVVLLLGKTQKRARNIAVIFSLTSLAVAVLASAEYVTGAFSSFIPANKDALGFGFVEHYDWVPSLGMSYILGVDGISLPLVFLTPLLSLLGMIFSWDKDHRPREFFAMILLIQMAITGVFISLDFFLFLVFWELVLIPMFFLIGIWGGPNKAYASIKFLIYTHVGSVIMMLGIFAMYWNVSPVMNPTGARSFDMLVLLNGATNPALRPALVFQIPAFIAFFFGFGVKLPMVPFHTWLPDAHVEAPTAGSVILAGLLLKMGGYGIFRVCLGMLPDAAKELWWVLALFGIVSMIYASFVCLAQVDFKRLIAYSSIAHMGFVLLGAASLSTIGIAGGVFQLFNHGLITAVLFMLAGTVKHAAGTRDIPKLRGLAKRMPLFSFVLIVSFFASMGLPGLNGFVSEFMVFVGSYQGGAAVLAPGANALGKFILIPLISVAITGAYYLWTMQKMVFGDFNEDLGKVRDLEVNELIPFFILLTLILIVGLYPSPMVNMIQPPAARLASLIGGG
jgi:proton-translocating NADH-quinone oxidoreductase chain M